MMMKIPSLLKRVWLWVNDELAGRNGFFLWNWVRTRSGFNDSVAPRFLFSYFLLEFSSFAKGNVRRQMRKCHWRTIYSCIPSHWWWWWLLAAWLRWILAALYTLFIFLFLFFGLIQKKKSVVVLFVGRHQMWEKYAGFLGHRFISY